LKAHREGKTKFYPDRWTKVYTHWLENIRDWCISRQIWWGHQIPVWYCDPCLEKAGRPEGAGIIVSREAPVKCPQCGGTKLRQDGDVLDTWFSSWLWPFSTLGWPEETDDLKHFYPTSDLVTAPEIIFFWVARMIMAGLEFRGEVPFSRICIHGTVRAQSGLKMSKSLGNAIDPLEVIDEIGADALRFSMIMLSAQDVYLSREKFEVGRNFANKLWNAARFVMMNLEGFHKGTAHLHYDLGQLSLTNRWILSRLEEVTGETERYLGGFGLAQASSALYHFVWDDFCDWFIELAKPTLTGESVEEKEATQAVLFYTLEKILKLLHPFVPFITEEIWQEMKKTAVDQAKWPASLMLADWPWEPKRRHEDRDAEQSIAWLQTMVGSVRDLRARLNIQPAKTLKVVLASRDEKVRKIFIAFENQIKKLARLEVLEIQPSFQKGKSYVTSAFPNFEVFLFIEGIVDFDKERARIEGKIRECVALIESVEKRLSDTSFTANAPEAVVTREKEKLADASKVLKAHEELLALLK
ncbi:MAG: class I tRNA ligase family protein, partial [Candidatus Omnitrophica bacterium]|nr:class I tRNA ligase family protein [Candidatus Omnitrophota bacterium]